MSCVLPYLPWFCIWRIKRIIKLYRFPPQEETRALWTAALEKGGWEPSNTDLVCSLHFHKSDFTLNSVGAPMELTTEAVPSINIHEIGEVSYFN